MQSIERSSTRMKENLENAYNMLRVKFECFDGEVDGSRGSNVFLSTNF